MLPAPVPNASDAIRLARIVSRIGQLEQPPPTASDAKQVTYPAVAPSCPEPVHIPVMGGGSGASVQSRPRARRKLRSVFRALYFQVAFQLGG